MNYKFGIFTKALKKLNPFDTRADGKPNEVDSPETGGLAVGNRKDDVFKAYIPWYLYKPPYGFPREVNPLQLRQLAKNPYIFSVIKTIQDEVASTPFEIVLKEDYVKDGVEEDEVIVKQIGQFFENPNGNPYESFEYIQRQWVNDICQVDSGVGVKVFDKAGRFSQLFARDGGTFLLNPDIYGYIGNRDDIVEPPLQHVLQEGLEKITTPKNGNGYEFDEKDFDYMEDKFKNESYDQLYQERAAYFQYGWTAGARPVPFGKREIIWIVANPRTESIYGRSPLEVLREQILTLIYGSEYNLSFYLNNNLPTGILTAKGATKEQAEAYRALLENQFMEIDQFGEFKKKHFSIPISSKEFIWTPMQMSSKELEIIEQQKWFSKLVWGAFGVTAEEMGYTEDSNKSTSENQSRVTKRRAVKPFLSSISYAINKQLMYEFGYPEYEFKYIEYDLAEDTQKHALWETEIRMGVKSAKMIAMEEFGIDEKVFNEMQKEKMAQEQEQIDMESEGEGVEGSEETDNKPEEKEKTETKAHDYNYELSFVKDELESPLEKELLNQLTILEGLIATQVESQFKENQLANVKGYVDVKSKVDDLLSQYDEFFEDDTIKLKISDFLDKALMLGVESFEKKFSVNTTVSPDKSEFFKDYVYENIKDMNQDLINKLRQIISMGILNRDNLISMTDKVEKIFNSTRTRAIAISRTETNRAFNEGSNEAAINSGLDLVKEWSAHLDMVTSKVCRFLDGKIVNLKEKFMYKGEGFDKPPAHVNCRSRILYIQREDLE